MADNKGMKRPIYPPSVRVEGKDLQRAVSMTSQELLDEWMARLIGGNYQTMRTLMNCGRNPSDWGNFTEEQLSRPTAIRLGPGDLIVTADGTRVVTVNGGTALQWDDTGCDDDDARLRTVRIPRGQTKDLTLDTQETGHTVHCGIEAKWAFVDYSYEARVRKISATSPEEDYNVNCKRRPDCRANIAFVCEGTGSWAVSPAAVLAAVDPGYFILAIITVRSGAQETIETEDIEMVPPVATISPYLGGFDFRFASPCHLQGDRTPAYGLDLGDYKQGQNGVHAEVKLLAAGAWYLVDSQFDWRWKQVLITDICGSTSDIRTGQASCLSIAGTQLSADTSPTAGAKRFNFGPGGVDKAVGFLGPSGGGGEPDFKIGGGPGLDLINPPSNTSQVLITVGDGGAVLGVAGGLYVRRATESTVPYYVVFDIQTMAGLYGAWLS